MNEQMRHAPDEVFSWAYEFTEDDVVQSFAYLIAQNSLTRKARIILFTLFVIIPVGLTVLGLLGYLAGNDVNAWAIGVSAGISVTSVWVFWMNRSPEIKARQAVKTPAPQNSLPEFLQLTELTIFRSGLAVCTRNTKTEYNWDAILGTGITKDHIHFMTSPQQAASVPKRVMSDKEFVHLMSFLRDHVNGPMVDAQYGESVRWSDVDRKTGEIITDRPHCKKCKSPTDEIDLRPVWWFVQPFHGQHVYCPSCRPAASRKEALTGLLAFAILAAI